MVYLKALNTAVALLQRRNDDAATTNIYSKPTTRPSNLARRRTLVAILPVLVTAIALTLSVLCVYAGHNTTMMQDYAVFTLNTSRLGEDVVQKLENHIRDFQLSDIGLRRRAELVQIPVTQTAPLPLVTLAPRVPGNIFSVAGSLESKATHHIASDAESLKSKGESDVSKVTSYIHSKATSLESAVGAEATSIVVKIEDELISFINQLYTGMIEDMKVTDFYNVHVMADCTGTYVFNNGTNVTAGDSGVPVPGTVHQHVDTCEQHSAIDPMSLVKVTYWVGIVFGAVSLLGSVVSVFTASRKIAAVNFLASLFAFMALALASAVTHGLALAATKVINFVGADLGLAAYLGQKFLNMTWAATGLIGANLVLALVMFMLDKRWGEGRQVKEIVSEDNNAIPMTPATSEAQARYR